ncbi:MAG TPA: HD domain-containing protein, partial [Ktedonobacterales bacterium]|nr:HD domain-containing protein [Ktedonobacterales bacterium]
MTTHETPRRRAGQTPKPRPQPQPQPHLSSAARDAAGLAQPAASLWDMPAATEPALPDSEPVSAIRDSLYELIPVGALEVELIGTAEFIRLQGVKQLGFVQRVWPGATHSRFEHSLGVYFLMLRALRAVRAQSPEAVSADATDLRTVLAAALLHDIGHYPFSHAIEELGYPIMPHERVGR